MTIKFLYVLAVLALLNHGRIIPKMKNVEPCKGDNDIPVELGSCVCAEGHAPEGCECGGTAHDIELCACSALGDFAHCMPVPCSTDEDTWPCFCTAGGDPAHCIPTPCGTTGDNFKCLCSEYDQINPEGCICSKAGEPDECKYIECRDSTAVSLPCNCVTDNDPKGCRLIECTGENDYASCLCREGTYDDCVCPDGKTYTVACKQAQFSSLSDCSDGQSIAPGFCKCAGESKKPKGCVCKGADDDGSNCLCNDVGTDPQGGCLSICGVGEFPDPDGCLCADEDTTCKLGACTGPNTPFGCACAKETFEGYDSALCAEDKAFWNMGYCLAASGTKVEDGFCRCESGHAPVGCTCARSDDFDYGKTDCEEEKFDALLDCTGNELPDVGCKCKGSFNPTGCTCPKVLTGIDIVACPCQGDADPRRGTTCPVITPCTSSVVDPKCLCATDHTDPGCICQAGEGLHPSTCVCDVIEGALLDIADCQALFECEEKDVPSAGCLCPAADSNGVYDHDLCIYEKLDECTGGDTDSKSVEGTCICKKGGFAPTGCICPDFTDITKLADFSTDKCVCNGDDDPRRGTTCKVTRECGAGDALTTPCLCSGDKGTGECTCTLAIHADQDCVCDEAPDATYSLAACQTTKICTQYEVPNPLCTCPTGDGGGYTQAFCQEDKACPKVVADSVTPSGRCVGKSIQCQDVIKLETLVGVDIVTCPCKTTGDPRAGDTCPAYCVDNEYEEGCACDSTETDYTECEEDKAYAALLKCTAATTGSVSADTCLCDGATNSPTNCVCPREGASLTGVPVDKCPCEGAEGDVRIGVICPVVRVCAASDPLTTDCLCSAAKHDGLCICTDTLKEQTCKCDPNGQPSLTFQQCQESKICTSYEQPNPSCTCPTDPTRQSNDYLRATCIAEKACDKIIADDATKGAACGAISKKCKEMTLAELVAAGTTSCPCYAFGDPRDVDGGDCEGESPACDDSEADLSDVPKEICGCTGDEDPREECVCIAYRDPANCKCPPAPTGHKNDYSYNECEAQKSCEPVVTATADVVVGCEGVSKTCEEAKTDDALFITVPKETCACLPTGDIRADGTICPAYCTAKDTPSAACVCDTVNQGTYTPAKCAEDKLPTPETYDCAAIDKDTPVAACACPTVKKELKKDPRYTKGGLCAAGSMRAALAVMVSALIIPALILFF